MCNSIGVDKVSSFQFPPRESREDIIEREAQQPGRGEFWKYLELNFWNPERTLWVDSLGSILKRVSGEAVLIAGFNPLENDRKAAKKHVMDCLEFLVEAWFDEGEELAQQSGKLVADQALPRTPNEHMTWLLMHQISRRDYGDIATREGKQRQTVSKAVNETGTRLGLKIDKLYAPKVKAT